MVKRVLLLVFVISSSITLFSSNPDFFFRGNPIAGLITSLGAPGSGGDQRVPAPNFCLTDLEGSEFCLEDFRGRVVVIDFMATWCLACEDQAVQLREVHKRYGGVEVVFVSIDVDLSESRDQLKSFRDYLGAKWWFAIDTAESRVGLKYETKYLPTLYVVDKLGFVTWSGIGLTEANALMQILDRHV